MDKVYPHKYLNNRRGIVKNMKNNEYSSIGIQTVFDAGNPPRIIFGKDSVKNNLPGILKEYNPKRILLVSDEFVYKTGATQKVGNAIKSANFNYEEYLLPVGEPTMEMARNVANFARQKKPDLLIGVGGGSVMDMTKLMSIMITNEGDPLDFCALPPDPWSDKVKNYGVNKILIPTTAGTGSETSNTLVIIEKGYKTWITSFKVTANVSLVDPTLTYTMPPDVTRNTGMDALSHLIEGVISNLANPISDGLIVQGVRIIGKYLVRAYNNPNDEEARVNMSFAAMLGGWVIAFPWVGGPATIGHCMSEALGPKFNIPHGLACAIMLPHAMDYNLPLIAPRLRPIAEALGVDTYHMDDFQAGKAAVEAVVRLMHNLEMPVALKDTTKLTKESLFEMLDYILNERQIIYNLPVYNPRRLTKQNLEQLFDDIWYGRFSGIKSLNI